MKKNSFSIICLSMLLICALVLAGCGKGSNALTAAVRVQLINPTTLTAYPVSQMTVTIQKSGSAPLTGITNASGLAVIDVSETGVFQVIKVDGVDATNLAENSEGREFVKASPLADFYPNLSYSFASPPDVNVTALGSSYPVDAQVPAINKVTVLKKGTAATTFGPHLCISAGTGPFSGRVVLTNLSFDDNKYSIKLQSSHTNGNSLIIYPSGGTPALSEAKFYGGPSWSLTELGLLNSYLASGPVCFEAPGNGDWALGYNNSSTDMKTRQSYGGADVIRDFPAFDGGDSGHAVFILYNMMGGTDATKHYSTDYSILKFDVL